MLGTSESPKLMARGSIPHRPAISRRSSVAERFHGREEVAGSIPAVGSIMPL